MTLRLSALFEDRVQALLSLSDARKTRKQKPRTSTSSNDLTGSGLNDKRKYAVSNDAVASRNSQDSTLRLVLRRNGHRAESLDGSGSVETPTSSMTADSVISGRTSPRRTGIAINLRTGRSRELSDESSSPVEQDGPATRKSISSSDKSDTRRKKPKRCVMPREYLYQRRERNASQTNGNTGSGANTRSKDNQINGREENEGKTAYSTRSGRQIRPKRFALETDSEKENKEKENGLEKLGKRSKRRNQNSEREETEGKIYDFIWFISLWYEKCQKLNKETGRDIDMIRARNRQSLEL